MTMTKICTKCKKEFLATTEYFYRDRKTKDGLYSQCKKCYMEKRKEYLKENKEKIRRQKKEYYEKNKEKNEERRKKLRKENPEKFKNKRLINRYGIILEEYNKILEEQNNVCAICEKNNKNEKELCVDHNHETGEVRGLLCHKCNLFLGVIEIYKNDPNKWDNYFKKYKMVNRK